MEARMERKRLCNPPFVGKTSGLGAVGWLAPLADTERPYQLLLENNRVKTSWNH